MGIVIRKGVLRGETRPKDIRIDGDRIVEIADRVSAIDLKEIEADGKLIIPGLVNPHLHLDKVLTGHLVKPSRTLEEALKANRDYLTNYSVYEVKSRVRGVLESAILHGTTALRAFVDVDKVCGVSGVQAILDLKKEYIASIDLQITPFVYDYRVKGSEELLVKAAEMGSDVIGGVIFLLENGMSEEECRNYVDRTFSIAKRFDLDVHMLVDDQEDPNSHLLEYYANKTIREGFQGRTTASHAEALSVVNDIYASKVIKLVKSAGMSICANGHVNLGRDDIVLSRGNTRVREFMDAGVNVTTGQDDVDDFYYPFGIPDMLEVAFMASHLARLITPEGLDATLDMVTINAAKALRLKDYGLRVGAKANLVVLDARTVRDALRLRPGRTVIKNGRVVAESRMDQKLFLR